MNPNQSKPPGRGKLILGKWIHWLCFEDPEVIHGEVAPDSQIGTLQGVDDPILGWTPRF